MPEAPVSSSVWRLLVPLVFAYTLLFTTGCHCLQVVQPIFHFMAEQVFELGQPRRQGLEAAVRMAYDDITESMANPHVVRAALAALPNVCPTVLSSSQPAATAALQNAAMDASPGASAAAAARGPSSLGAGTQRHTSRPPFGVDTKVQEQELYWTRLLALSARPVGQDTRIPWQGDMQHYQQQIMAVLCSAGQATSGTAAGLGGGGGDGQSDNSLLKLLRKSHAGAEWWSRVAIRKTFVEHRSMLMPLLGGSSSSSWHGFTCWLHG